MSTRVWETALAPSGGVQESQVLRLLFVSDGLVQRLQG